MRVGMVDRVKQQLLRDAVKDNLDTMRGIRRVPAPPPRENVWMRRLPLLLIPITLLGSSYLVSEPPVLRTAAPVVAPQPRIPVTQGAFEAVKAAAFPLAVRRVILDAGHGGKDAGARSATNVSE